MDRTDNPRRTILICVLLGAITLAAFGPVFRNGFVSYDDSVYVTENPHVLAGLSWASAGWAFRTDNAANWHPLTWLSHILDVEWFGLNPAGHHFTSLLLHAGNVVLLFRLLKGLTGALWRSACVAALFALHPLHVESVAWVAERKDVLSAFFFMLTLLAYTRFVEVQSPSEEVQRPMSKVQRPGNEAQSLKSTVQSQEPSSFTFHVSRFTFHASRFYVLSLTFFALGLMSKPMLVTLPGVLLLLDFWPLRRLHSATAWSLVVEKVPFLALSLASSVLTFLIQQSAGAVSSLEALSLDFRVSNALISYVCYALKMIWPAKLAVIYPLPHEWPVGWVVGAALVLAGLSVMALYRARKAPYLAFGWFWYLGMLVPVIGIVQVGLQAMADRYTYLPLVGLFVAIVWSAAEISARWPVTRSGLAVCAATVIAACALLTWNQTGHWRSTASLFEHALAVTQDNAVAHNNLGVNLLDAGKLTAAEGHFAEAVRIKANYPDGLGNLGLCWAKQGRLEEAAELFRLSLRARPNGSVHYNFANLLSQLGDLEQAEAHYEAALRLKPDLVEAWYNLGALEAKRGKTQEAAQDYAAALRIKPDYVEAHLSLGALLAGQKKFDEAIVQFQAAVHAAPDKADAHFNLAAALNAQGDFAGAATHYAEACRLRPDDVEARQSLGLALFCQGKLSEAAAQYQAVLRAHPSAGPHYYLALALDGQGQAAEAAAHYREAIRLEPKTPLYLNDLAWLLATGPGGETRNGKEAVRLAEEACRLSGGKVARFWGTLDAAYAEAGRFEEALATVTKTRELALAAGQPDIAKAAEERLVLYREHKPYRSWALPATAP